MTDDFEPRVERWLRERGTVDAETLASVAGQIALLPRRRAGLRRPWLAAAAAVVVMIAVGVGIVVGPRISGGPSPVPPDPAAFAGDPRLTACFGGAGEVQYAVRDGTCTRLPAAPPEDVAVARARRRCPGLRGRLRVGRGAERRRPRGPGARPVRRPLRRRVIDLSASWSTTRRICTPTSTSTASARRSRRVDDRSTHPLRHRRRRSAKCPRSPTIQPAPSWVADLAGQLECDGAIADIGGEVDDFGAGPGADRRQTPTPPSRACSTKAISRRSRPRASSLRSSMATGRGTTTSSMVGARPWRSPRTSSWACRPRSAGRSPAIRACDPSEFDPADGLTFDTDALARCRRQRRPVRHRSTRARDPSTAAGSRRSSCGSRATSVHPRSARGARRAHARAVRSRRHAA